MALLKSNGSDIFGEVSDLSLRFVVEKLGLSDSESLFKIVFFDILNELAGVEGWDSSQLAKRRLGNNSFVTYYEYMTTGVTRRGKRKLNAACSDGDE